VIRSVRAELLPQHSRTSNPRESKYGVQTSGRDGHGPTDHAQTVACHESRSVHERNSEAHFGRQSVALQRTNGAAQRGHRWARARKILRFCPKTSTFPKSPTRLPLEIVAKPPAQECKATAPQRAVSGQSQGSRLATHQYSVAYVSAPPELRRRQGFVGFTGCRYRLPTFRGLFSRRYLVLLPVIVYM
jgi:hypothetical protein